MNTGARTWTQRPKHSAAIMLTDSLNPCAPMCLVVDTEQRLFVHYKHKGRFHHSSFLRGAAVLAAGNLVVEEGQLMKLTPDSGHYRPHSDNFKWLVHHLRGLGADLSQAQLTAKHVEF